MSDMDSPLDLDATAQAELVSRGEVSASELVEGAIARAEALDPALNAIIHPLFGEALAQVDEAPDGPFHGVPFLFKDIGACLAGQPLYMGMKVLKDADFRAPMDSWLGRRFADAGLVAIGKTNVPELGTLPTTEPMAFGPTHNPWDLERTPGGSSGGSAAAVAAGIVPVAHANDGGGSIRIPASCCGLVGLKPTRARTTQGPMLGDVMSGLVEEFVLTRSVRDAARMLDTVAGSGPGDPYVAPEPSRSYVAELDEGPRGLRVGVALDPPTAVESDPAVREAAQSTANLLEELGHTIVDAELPGSEEGSTGGELTESFMVRWYAGQAATIAQLEVILGREIGSSDLEPMNWELVQRGRSSSAGDYVRAVSLHQAIGRMIAEWFDAGHDLLLTPTLAEIPPKLGSFDQSGPDPLEAMRRARPMGAFTAVYNATGHPAISLPLAETAEGLPVGVQLVAPFGREDLLIGVAADLERARPWAERRPTLVDGASTR